MSNSTENSSALGEGVFVKLSSNAGFKHAFADKTNIYALDALKSLLNFYLPEDRQIDEISDYLNSEVPGFTTNNRDIVIDIRCKDIHGRQFIVEMQSYTQDTFFVRTVAYLASVYRENLGKGIDGYKSLTPVYLVAFMNVPLTEEEFKNDHRVIARYEFRDLDNKYFAPKTLSATFVRLEEIPKLLEDCNGIQERCAWVVKNSHLISEIPVTEDEEIGIRDILSAAEIAKYDIQKKQKYEEDIMFELDYYATLDTAKRLGREEGLAEGVALGETKGEAKGKDLAKQEIIIQLASKNMSASQISELLDMPLESIEKILGK